MHRRRRFVHRARTRTHNPQPRVCVCEYARRGTVEGMSEVIKGGERELTLEAFLCICARW